jgi:glycosyltransferase involved in cell wall biosynthesis
LRLALLHVDVGIIVYNEEKNIIKLLESLSNQKLKNCVIDKIFVVSSGSTDKTNELVLKYKEKDNRVYLLTQNKRQGKPSAINEFLKNSKKDIVVISSGDLIFSPEALENLIAPFRDKTVGMTSAFPVPINENKGFMGFVANMHWKMHNLLNRHGESISFRKNLVKYIPCAIVADEAYVESVVKKKENKVVHVKDAVVFNKGPETIPEFLKQTRRHFFGHLQLKFELHYSVSSMTKKGINNILKELVMRLVTNSREIPYCLGYLFLETLGRILGTFDFVFGKRNYVLWEIAQSTKSLKVNNMRV